MSTPGSWASQEITDRVASQEHTDEHNRLYNEGLFYAEQATPSLDVGKFLQIVGSDPIRVEGLDIDYQPAGDYVESTDITNIVVVDNGMMPATPDPFTLYLEREV